MNVISQKTSIIKYRILYFCGFALKVKLGAHIFQQFFFFFQVEAMSTEKSVRVRVKVYDNTTSIYSQDIEITAGEGTFIVPAILADSDVIALQVNTL